MKKLSIVALALGLLAITACNNKKEEAIAPAQAEVEVITDSAFQEKVAGEYKSLDQQTVITLNKDLTASVKGYNKEYYKWGFVTKPEVTTINIELIRKGADTDVKDEALLDVEEGKLVLKNETFRKAAK